MYKKYVIHLVVAIVKYLFSYDHDIMAQVMVAGLVGLLFIKQVRTACLVFIKETQKNITDLFNTMLQFLNNKKENEQGQSISHSQVEKDIAMWQ